jgi:CBS domain containing-hemolysin-like protein
MTMNSWIVVAVSLFFSALCSGLEIAFNSINRLQLEVELTKNSFSAKLISLFFKNQSRFITSLLLGNNIALIIYGMSMSQLLDAPVNHWLQYISFDNAFMVLLVKTILSTLLVLLVAEFASRCKVTEAQAYRYLKLNRVNQYNNLIVEHF